MGGALYSAGGGFAGGTLTPYKQAVTSGYFAQREQNRLARMQARQQMQQMGQAGQGFQAGLGGLSRLVGSYGRAYGTAKRANEARYRQLLRIANRTTGQREADIRSEGFGREADITQGLMRQGMAGTTIAPTMREGVRRGTSEQLNRLADVMQQTKLGIIERREDKYPDPNIIMSLAGAMGQGAGAGGMAGDATGRMVQALSRMRLG